MELQINYEDEVLSFLRDTLHLNITPEIKDKEGKISAYFDIPDDEMYGVIFSKLDKNSNIELLDEDQFVTEQGSSLVYTTKEKPYYVISLIADYLNEKYSLNVIRNKESRNEQE